MDISGYGLRVNVKASVTFPVGINISAFADDADPIDAPSMQIKDKAMGVNGDLVTWGAANPINVTLSLIPNTEDDRAMATLFEANRVGKGKNNPLDVITMTVVYPDGSVANLSGGAITDGIPLNSVASAGRMKSKPYVFTFENMARS